MFKKDEIIICIINSRASLTIGKEYKVTRADRGGNPYIVNDVGDDLYYSAVRFIGLDEFRRIKLEQLNKSING